METKCSVKGCDSPVYVQSHNLCSKHYNRLRTTGSVADGPRARAPLEERFAKYVEVRGKNECWPWIGKQNTQGYGSIGIGGRDGGRVLAHRLAYEIANGPIPHGSGAHGTVVRHKCDNRECVNPAHLELGTQADNVRDQIERGNFVPPSVGLGESHPNSRFTEADVRYIRASTKSNAALGREFGVARQVIGAIRRRITWKHLE